jgi:hypothetical protein
MALAWLLPVAPRWEIDLLNESLRRSIPRSRQ